MGGCQRPALTHSHMTWLSHRTLRHGHHCPLSSLSHFLPLSPGLSHSTAMSGECLSGEAQLRPLPSRSLTPCLPFYPCPQHLHGAEGAGGLKLCHLHGSRAWLEPQEPLPSPWFLHLCTPLPPLQCHKNYIRWEKTCRRAWGASRVHQHGRRPGKASGPEPGPPVWTHGDPHTEMHARPL